MAEADKVERDAALRHNIKVPAVKRDKVSQSSDLVRARKEGKVKIDSFKERGR